MPPDKHDEQEQDLSRPVAHDVPNVPGQIQYGSLRLPADKSNEGAVIPIGGGSEVYALGEPVDTTREGKNDNMEK